MQRHRQNEKIQQEEQQRTNDIIADMTRQYKATMEELMEKEAQLTMKIDQNEDELKTLNAEKESIQAKKKKEEEEKDETINALKRNIE